MNYSFIKPGGSVEKQPSFTPRNHTLKLIMRISYINIFLLIASLKLVATPVYVNGQTIETTTVKLELQDASLKSVFQEIEKQTEFRFLTAAEKVNLYSGIDLPTGTYTVKEVLEQVLVGTTLKYEQREKYILVFFPEENINEMLKGTEKKAEVTAEEPLALISGKVTDAKTQTPLPGVNVLVKGTAIGMVTDADGNFRIEVPNEDDILVFSYIGYATQEVQVSGRSVINIALAEDVQSLEEIVVVGYGTQKKVNLTGAVSTVSYDELADRPTQNVASALQGVVNGLNISTGAGGGMLNVAPTINIRGTGTIASVPSGGTSSGGFSRPNPVPQNSLSTPLILINGVEGDINSLNPQDIDNISILKDAASSSIYGSRAAFGVMLITTKSGKMGKDLKPTISYSGDMRFSAPIGLTQYASAWDASKYNIVAYGNSGSAPTYLGPILLAGQQAFAEGTGPEWGPIDPLNPKFYPMYFGSTDWNTELYKSSVPSNSHSLNIRGGGENYSYYLSGNRLDQDGLLRASPENFARNTFNVNLAGKLSKKVKIEYIGGFNLTKYEAPSYLQWGFFYTNSRRIAHQPYRYEDGLYASDPPVALQDGGRYVQNRDQNQHKLTLSYEPVKNWNIHVNGSTNITTDLQRVNQNAIFLPFRNGEKRPVGINTSAYGQGTGDTYVGNKSFKDRYYTTNIFSDYFRQTDNGHYIKGLLGFQAEYYHTEGFGVGKTGVISPDVIALDGATSVPRDVFGNSQTWTAAGFFGRINYNYKEKYLLEVNGRYDGASRFIGDKRWGIFPSFSAGWNISNETFFEPLSRSINLLKVRGSYGSLGNMNTTNWYPFYPTIPLAIGQVEPARSGVNWAGGFNWLVNGALSNASSAPGLVSSLLTWERVKSWDIGLDFGLFENRLTGNFDIFRRITEGMVGPPPPLTNTLGTTTPPNNNANLLSKGFEVLVSWNDDLEIGNSPFYYSVGVNVSDEVQSITKYNNSNPSFYTWYAGRQLGEIWGYTTKGIARTDQEMTEHLESLPNGGQSMLGLVWQSGDIMYEDVNGDGRISSGSGTLLDPGDVTIIGNDLPRYKFGFNLVLAWKGFDVRGFLQGVAKRDMWPATQRVVPGYSDGDFTFWGIAGDASNQQILVPHMDFYREEGDPYGANIDSYYPRPYTHTAQNQLTQTRYLQDGAYMRVKNIQVGYSLPTSLIQRLRINKARVYVSGENLFTFTSLTSVIDPEAYLGMSTPQGGSGSIGTAYPISKVYAVGLNLNF